MHKDILHTWCLGEKIGTPIPDHPQRAQLTKHHRKKHHCCGVVASLWVAQLFVLLAICTEYPPLSQRWLGPAQHRGSQERRSHSKFSLSAKVQLDSVTPGDSLPHLSRRHSIVWVRQRHHTTHSAWLLYLKQLKDSRFPNPSLLL